MVTVPDASIALKWVLPEDDASAARDLLRRDTMVAPDFILLECANVLTVRIRRGLADARSATESLRVLAEAPVRLTSTGPLVPHAQALAIELSHSAYDCLYLALALAEQASLVTADTRFARAAEARYPGMVRLLGA